MPNPETLLTLDDCVEEILGLLTGLELSYQPTMNRYRAVTRQLNRALRSNALEKEWSCYSTTESLGTAVAGEQTIQMRSTIRPRQTNDDAVRLVDADTQHPVRWAYFLPRDAIHKQPDRTGLWACVIGQLLQFSRPFHTGEDGLEILLPVMREPRMFRLPAMPEDPNEDFPEVPDAVRNQPLDFPYPDVIVLRAAFYYAQTDPVMQPRVQTIEAQYKDLMYQIIERDDRNTDSPSLNEWSLPISSGLHDHGWPLRHAPTADERR